MIFPFDSEGGFSDPRAASPTQRPASRSDARKRDHPSEIRPKGGLSDPHLDNGFAKVIRKAQEQAWDRLCNWLDAHDDSDVRNRVKDAAWASNPYREAS